MPHRRLTSLPLSAIALPVRRPFTAHLRPLLPPRCPLVISSSPLYHPHTPHSLPSGSVIGLQQFLTGVDKWPHSLKAKTRVDVWVLEIDAFKNFMISHEKLCAAFCKCIGKEMANHLALHSRSM